MVEDIKLVFFSFLASLGFGIVFRIEKKNLIWAGVGGALTRCVYLYMIATTDQAFLQYLLSAMFAALFAEIMAMRQKMPSTVFLYPAIIPLVPGGLLYSTVANLVMKNMDEMTSYLWQLLIALAGICIGFVVISTFTYYRRIYKVGQHIARSLFHNSKKKK